MKIQELIEKHKSDAQEKADEARQELAVLEALATAFPAGINPSRIHVHRLYGSVASIHFGDSFVGYGKPDNRYTVQEVAGLLDIFPPVKIWNIKNGCTAMRPDWDVKDKDILPDKDARDHWGVMLDIEPGFNSGGPKQSVKWFTERNGVRFSIECILKPEHYPASVDIKTQKSQDETWVERTEIQSRGSFWLDQRIKWSPGSHQYANKFTVYWLSIDDSQGAGKAWLEQICGHNFPPNTQGNVELLERTA